MPTKILSHVAELLTELGEETAFTARRTASAANLQLEVKGLGRLQLPVSDAQAKKLVRLARPASYGKGEETLVDRKVRDTWEVPLERVRIERERWDRTLLPMVEALGQDLGLPEGRSLRAELHSMLVYEPGQFFLPHQDSEKGDGMVATLVVQLPTASRGGALVVRHRGQEVKHLGAPKSLACFAFYADCRHEVLAAKSGYRITLTYNLLLGPGEGGEAQADPATTAALAPHLRAYFETPLPPRWAGTAAETEREPPNRLVYLLDHEYTERGLSWNQLKGHDAPRAASLLAAAEQAGCEAALALAEIHETWQCLESDWEGPFASRGSWDFDEDDDEEDEDDLEPGPAETYELTDLIDGELVLTTWLAPGEAKPVSIALRAEADEVCTSTPTVQLEPYETDHEGYMGNYGNTVDRWYRRAAVVLWPWERAFVVRAEASAAWALEELERLVGSGQRTTALTHVASLPAFWRESVAEETRSRFAARALQVAADLDDPEAAASLLAPFSVSRFRSGSAKAWVAVTKRYGEAWVRDLVAAWAAPTLRRLEDELEEEELDEEESETGEGLAPLATLCTALRKVDGTVGQMVACLLAEEAWPRLERDILAAPKAGPPSRCAWAFDRCLAPLVALVRALAAAGAPGEALVARLGGEGSAELLPLQVKLLRAVAALDSLPAQLAAGLETIRGRALESLRARLANPARNPDDWSLALAPGCACDLCQKLGTFLGDRTSQTLEWPLAEQGRRHVHQRIDHQELPVRHETRRSGRPYTLLLTKLPQLHKTEASERKAWQADLKWLEAHPVRG
jgi:2OG-Fe(II) oxygenase superfamily